MIDGFIFPELISMEYVQPKTFIFFAVASTCITSVFAPLRLLVWGKCSTRKGRGGGRGKGGNLSQSKNIYGVQR